MNSLIEFLEHIKDCEFPTEELLSKINRDLQQNYKEYYLDDTSEDKEYSYLYTIFLNSILDLEYYCELDEYIDAHLFMLYFILIKYRLDNNYKNKISIYIINNSYYKLKAIYEQDKTLIDITTMERIFLIAKLYTQTQDNKELSCEEYINIKNIMSIKYIQEYLLKYSKEDFNKELLLL